jgi:NAD(P)-dependent dehydrogenase (short-subunit alcohol dehydrogenase family)
MRGKLVLLTGITGVMGKETAVALAKMGATVVCSSRLRESGETAVAEIKAASGSDNVDLLVADLASQSQIRQMAAAFKQRYGRLDVLINNAGTYRADRDVTEDGMEYTLAVNHLAPYLLTACLIDTLKAPAPARIINLTSGSHAQGHIDFDDLQSERNYSFFKVGGMTKLALLLFTYELAERLNGSGVTANAVHPGLVPKGTAKRYMPKGVQVMMGLLSVIPTPFTKSPEKGAETAVYLASSPDVEGVNGQYFVDKKPTQSSPASYDVETRGRLWEVSAALTGLPVDWA